MATSEGLVEGCTRVRRQTASSVSVCYRLKQTFYKKFESNLQYQHPQLGQSIFGEKAAGIML